MNIQQSLLKATLGIGDTAKALNKGIESKGLEEEAKLKEQNSLLKEYESIESDMAKARAKNYDFKYVASQLADKKARVILNMQRKSNREVMNSLKNRAEIIKKRIEINNKK